MARPGRAGVLGWRSSCRSGCRVRRWRWPSSEHRRNLAGIAAADLGRVAGASSPVRPPRGAFHRGDSGHARRTAGQRRGRGENAAAGGGTPGAGRRNGGRCRHARCRADRSGRHYPVQATAPCRLAAAAALLLLVMVAVRPRQAARQSFDAVALSAVSVAHHARGHTRERPRRSWPSLTIAARLVGNRAPVMAQLLRAADGRRATGSRSRCPGMATDAFPWRSSR